MPYFFTICDASRRRKLKIKYDKDTDSRNIVDYVIAKSNRILSINGVSLVADRDGEAIYDESTLECLRNETIMILEEDEVWQNISTKKIQHDKEDQSRKEKESKTMKKRNSCEEKEKEQSDVDDSFSNSETNKNKRARKSTIDVTESDDVNAGNFSESEDQENLLVNTKTADRCIDSTTQQDKPFPNIRRPFSKLENYEIEWEKFTCTAREKLNDKSRKWHLIRDVANGIVGEMRDIKKRIPVESIADVAEVLVDLCPDTFADKYKSGSKEGQIMGKGTATLIRKMVNRNNYLNRPHNSDDLNNTLKVPLKSRKLLQSLRVGCPNWQPEGYAAGITPDIAEEHRVFFLDYKNFSEDDEEIFHSCLTKFKESFPLQRLFLNSVDNPPKHGDIATTWPCLLDSFYLNMHFRLLSDCDVSLLAGSIESDIPTFLAYGTMKGFYNLDDGLTDHEKNILAIKTIFQYFDEPFHKLFLTLSVS